MCPNCVVKAFSVFVCDFLFLLLRTCRNVKHLKQALVVDAGTLFVTTNAYIDTTKGHEQE